MTNADKVNEEYRFALAERYIKRSDSLDDHERQFCNSLWLMAGFYKGLENMELSQRCLGTIEMILDRQVRS